ncbi:hypothetical protein Tco_0463986, partial [Tanacetum coccineum]
ALLLLWQNVMLAERDASRSRDGDNNHGSGTGGRRQVPTQ